MKIIPKIKICGLTNSIDAKLACKLGADYLGFIFAAKSPRALSKFEFANLIVDLPKDVKKVGVFVNSTQDDILEFLELGIEIVQLHGNETPEFVEKIMAKCEIWKAVNLLNESDLALNKKYFVKHFLVDSKGGGSGEICNWDLAGKFAQEKSIFLAGGISAKNVHEAWEKVHPFGFDLSSSLEESIGKKSPQKMYDFFEKIYQIN